IHSEIRDRFGDQRGRRSADVDLARWAVSAGRLEKKLTAIINAIQSPELANGELYPAIYNLARRERLFRNVVSINTDGIASIAANRFRGVIAQTMFDLVLEGLNNASHHMPGCSVRLEARLTPYELRMDIISCVAGG